MLPIIALPVVGQSSEKTLFFGHHGRGKMAGGKGCFSGEMEDLACSDMEYGAATKTSLAGGRTVVLIKPPFQATSR